MHLRIVSLNTWNCQGDFPKRLGLMKEGLKRLEPDIVILQEVFSAKTLGMNTAQELATHLGMTYAFVPARLKERCYQGHDMMCHSGLALLTTGLIIENQPISLVQDDRDGERVAQIGVVEINRLTLQIANLHLSHLEGEDDLRKQQLFSVGDELKKRDKAIGFSVIGGDMNLNADHQILENFANNEGYLSSSNALQNFGVTSLNPIGEEIGDQGLIDHLFVKAPSITLDKVNVSLALDKVDQTGLYPSDHKALVMNLSFSR